jgi:hypothetical protein
MIPKEIDNKHIELAAKEINSEGVPSHRDSRKYHVQIGNALYPPKYIISLAGKYLNGQEVDASVFDAPEARRYLEKKNYEIVTK